MAIAFPDGQLPSSSRRGAIDHEAAFGRVMLDSDDLACAISVEGVVLFASSAWSRLCGYAPSTLFGLHFSNLIHADDARAVEALLAAARGGAPDPSFEALIRRRDGAFINVEWRCWYDNDLDVLYGLGRLVPKVRHRSKRGALRDGIGIFTAIFDQLPVAVSVKNRALQRIFVNRECARFLEKSPDELIGTSADQTLRPEEAAFVEDIERTVLREKSPMRTIETFTRSDGTRTIEVSRFPLLDSSGEVWSVGAVALDVTKARETENTLRKSLDYTNALLQAWPDLLFVMDRNMMILDHVSHDKNDLVLPPEEFVGRSMFDVLATFDREVAERLRTTVESALSSGKPHAVEYRISTIGGGAPKDFEARAMATADAKILLVVRDITERKILESRATASAKMAALGEMASALAHEINNPLTVIFARSQQLYEAASVGEVNAERLAVIAGLIHRTSDRIARTIAALRSFSRDGRQDPFESCELSDVYAETWELSAARFRRHSVRIEWPPSDGFKVSCRPTQISQILLNLLSNALDAVSGLEVSRRWVRVSHVDIGSDVEITVSDGGDGPPEDAVGQIMLPFFTTKGPGEGTGLGLSISRGLAEEHGGTLCFSRSDGVTKFHLTLPKRQSEGN